jgi:hypothetical protein
MSILFADNFLAGSLLSLLLPTLLLTALAVWLWRITSRVPAHTPVSSPALPPPDVVAAAESEEGDTGAPMGA